MNERDRGFYEEIQGAQPSTSPDFSRFAPREAELQSELQGVRLHNSRVKNDPTQSRREIQTAIFQDSRTSSYDSVSKRHGGTSR